MEESNDKSNSLSPTTDKANRTEFKMREQLPSIAFAGVASVGALIYIGFLVKKNNSFNPGFELLGDTSVTLLLLGFLIQNLASVIYINFDVNKEKFKGALEISKYSNLNFLVYCFYWFKAGVEMVVLFRRYVVISVKYYCCFNTNWH